MKARAILTVNKLAASIGATGWRLVRENKHLVVEFDLPGRKVRQVLAATASDQRAVDNVRAQLRRSVRAV